MLSDKDAASSDELPKLSAVSCWIGCSNRPIGSFLFVGPTGVGKTELSKQLAIELFGSMTKYDSFSAICQNTLEKHAVAKLVGAPPGLCWFTTKRSS